MRPELRAALLFSLFFFLMLPAAAPALAQSAARPAATPPADAAALKRTELYRGPVAAADHEAVLMRVELATGGHAARHTHPGDEIVYVTDGEIEIAVDGQAPVRLKAGQGFSVPALKVHEARNVGTVPVRLIAAYVVEKGKPIASPAR
jgi:quercetin dioxygenase-like cupin family protein